MTGLVDALMVLLILSNVILLGSSRLGLGARVVAVQGVLVGVLPALVGGGHSHAAGLAVALAVVAVKGVLLPLLLWRILRDLPVRRERKPYIGYSASLLLGVAALGVAVALTDRLPPLAGASESGRLMMTAAFFSILAGLALLVTRRKALSQVLGYLVLENGIFAAGMALVPASPAVVELAILLDLLVGVFLMGILIFHIHREFDDIDTDLLAGLHDRGERV